MSYTNQIDLLETAEGHAKKLSSMGEHQRYPNLGIGARAVLTALFDFIRKTRHDIGTLFESSKKQEADIAALKREVATLKRDSDALKDRAGLPHEIA